MIWLIGVGLMGIEYTRVLKKLNVDFIAVGRGEKSAQNYIHETSHPCVMGGLDSYLEVKPDIPEAAIVAVGVESLSDTCNKLIEYGIRKILIEKPGVGWCSEIYDTLHLNEKYHTEILVAYNRRFYSSVIEAEKIIEKDGGVTSFNFEFTEWSHVIAALKKTKVEHNTWFLCNSTHVIDTAFYLGGWPEKIECFHKGGLDWHPSGSIYSGAGISKTGALFSYQANWEAPGRWVIEILTKAHRLYFKPMETLQIQNIGSVKVEPVEIDDCLDKEFKPGFYLQTKAFLEGDYSRFCTLEQQREHIETIYNKISGYNY